MASGGDDGRLTLYWEDIAQAVGKVFPCVMDGRTGHCVEARDEEGAAFGFATDPAHTLLGDKNEVILILERQREGAHVRWREVFRKPKRIW